MTIQKKVKIFTVEQQFPCGQNASCCGPTGQSEQEIGEHGVRRQSRSFGRVHDSHIEDAVLVECVANARFLAFAKVEQKVVFLRLGGAHQWAA